tara:strand:- start:470 stop:1459 length:990 start_codon:yes stop_codon:yes gene_type:complete
LNFFLKLFKLLPPELSHSFSLKSLNILYKLKILKFFIKRPSNDESFDFIGLRFKNRLGTAAGLDKNGDYIDSLGELGFGFLEVGTITPKAQKGNSKPRVFRNFKEKSIINRLGFNNKGVDYLVNNLKKRSYEGILGVNIGANKESKGPERINDYLICLEQVYKYSDYISINISSPNTPNLRELHNEDELKNLIEAIDSKVIELNIAIPIFLKISPDESNQVIDKLVKILGSSQLSGIIATNTTIDKSNIINKEFRSIDGGLSGAPLMNKATNKLSYIHAKSNHLPLIGVGGVTSKKDYEMKLQAGAQLVQIYSGFIIKGPKIINEILSN